MRFYACSFQSNHSQYPPSSITNSYNVKTFCIFPQEAVPSSCIEEVISTEHYLKLMERLKVDPKNNQYVYNSSETCVLPTRDGTASTSAATQSGTSGTQGGTTGTQGGTTATQGGTTGTQGGTTATQGGTQSGTSGTQGGTTGTQGGTTATQGGTTGTQGGTTATQGGTTATQGGTTSTKGGTTGGMFLVHILPCMNIGVTTTI